VVFKPDAKIFSTTEIDFEIVSKRLRRDGLPDGRAAW